MAAPGFRIRLHTALTMPIMLAGAPRQFAIINWTIAAALILGLHAYYLIPLFVIVHLVTVFLAKKDPYFFEILIRHLRQKRFYR